MSSVVFSSLIITFWRNVFHRHFDVVRQPLGCLGSRSRNNAIREIIIFPAPIPEDWLPSIYKRRHFFDLTLERAETFSGMFVFIFCQSNLVMICVSSLPFLPINLFFSLTVCVFLFHSVCRFQIERIRSDF